MKGREMKNRVLYATGSKESAKKVADAIAAGIAQAATPIEKQTAILGVNALFIGCEVNESGKIKGKVRKILQKLDSSEVKVVVGFATSSSGGASPKAEMKAILDPKGIKVSDDEFLCKGSKAFGNRGCPTDADLAKAREFSAKFLKGNRSSS